MILPGRSSLFFHVTDGDTGKDHEEDEADKEPVSG
jgi:hypothetical protein